MKRVDVLRCNALIHRQSIQYLVVMSAIYQQGQEEDKDGKLDVLYPYGFPLSLVKRIVTMDEDVRSISSDALKATSKAAELVLQSLAAKAFQVLVHHISY